MVGIELDQWSANGHDGKVKGRACFKASPGYSTFYIAPKVSFKKNILYAISYHKNVGWSSGWLHFLKLQLFIYYKQDITAR